jgi:hypothetical protein
MGCRGRQQVWAAQDAEYFKSLEAERIESSGTAVEYYSLNRGTHVDALYGEPDNDPLYGGESDQGSDQIHNQSWNFCPDVAGGEDPFIFIGAMEYVEAEQRNPMVRQEGKYVEYDAVLAIAVNTWECAIEDNGSSCLSGRVPKEGDVCYAFLEYWDVVKAGKSGNILGTPIAVGYRLELKKRTQFVPERKLDQ